MGFFLLGLQCLPHLGGNVPFPFPYHTHLYVELFSEWTEGECRDQLCWCLDGKASEYYALLVERNQEMVYMDLIQKLEKRFGFRELPENFRDIGKLTLFPLPLPLHTPPFLHTR
jgi:hypothetical protein